MRLPPAPDRWTIELANAERLEAIGAFGFTERQAQFLLSVLLHSGVFVERQYCSFAWSELRSGALRHAKLGANLRRCTIVSAEGSRGWANYRLLHHFNDAEPLDRI